VLLEMINGEQSGVPQIVCPLVGCRLSVPLSAKRRPALTPIKPQAELTMIESGWQVNTILPLISMLAESPDAAQAPLLIIPAG